MSNMEKCPICEAPGTVTGTTIGATANYSCGNALVLDADPSGKYDGIWNPVNAMKVTRNGITQGMHRCKKIIDKLPDVHRVANGLPPYSKPLDLYGYCMDCCFAKHHKHHWSESKKREDLDQENKTAIKCVCVHPTCDKHKL